MGGSCRSKRGPTIVFVTGTLTGGPFVNINIRHIPVFGAGFVLEINGTEGTLVASTDGRDLAARDIRSLGEQLNQAALSGARQGEPIRDMAVPATHRWVPDDVPSGPPLSMAQTWRKFAAGIVSGDPTPPDFAFGLRVHELYARYGRQWKRPHPPGRVLISARCGRGRKVCGLPMSTAQALPSGSMGLRSASCAIDATRVPSAEWNASKHSPRAFSS